MSRAVFLRRYLQSGETSYRDIIKRVLQTLGVIEKFSGRDVSEILGLAGKPARFVPSGRTLASADPKTKTILPSCCVLDATAWERQTLLEQRTGIGTNYDYCTSPEELAATLSASAAQPTPDVSGRVPGLMGTLDWRNSCAESFVLAKIDTNNNLKNFNLSLLVDEEFFASPLFKLSCKAAWICGDPGLLFPTKINSTHARGNCSDRLRATAPCGELFLHKFEVCTLGNLNLAAYVLPKSSSIFDVNYDIMFDLPKLRSDVHFAVRFLDHVIDHYAFVSTRMALKTKSLRRVGLGVMGWATALTKLGIPYDTKDALELGSAIARLMREEADLCTGYLAQEKGAPSLSHRERRNVSCLSLAPTGGTAPLHNVSYSIEPDFDVAHKVAPEWHVEMQSAWQGHVDAAVSKTVNLSSDATVADVEQIFRKAWNTNCRGITIYRDRCWTRAECKETRPVIFRNCN